MKHPVVKVPNRRAYPRIKSLGYMTRFIKAADKSLSRFQTASKKPHKPRQSA